MGLTRQKQNSKKAACSGHLIALAGNPNVGKSSLFNALTGSDQHTGNWTGKTVSAAAGNVRRKFDKSKDTLTFVDLPGTYSLADGSPEEREARDFIKSGRAEVTVAVCDACCLERGLILVLKLLELTPRVVVCLNLIDEARRKNIKIDTNALSSELHVPVVATSAATGEGLPGLVRAIRTQKLVKKEDFIPFRYPEKTEEKIVEIAKSAPRNENARLYALERLRDDPDVVSRPVIVAEGIAAVCTEKSGSGYSETDRRIDRIVMSRPGSIILGILLLCGVFWLTAVGANYPSGLLQRFFDFLIEPIRSLLGFLPAKLNSAIVDGMLATLFKVVSVMLPPMAIFFPLFTLLEDSGLFARIAFNSDGVMSRCSACSKQPLTMAMGLGCNAAGVVGCRIIESKKERLIAILTNNLMPCNGRFPILIAMSLMIGHTAKLPGTLAAAGIMTLSVLAAVGATLILSKILGKVIPGENSTLRLELPPYRKPRIGQVLIRSILDRTIFVLGRAAAVAAPAGLVIWILSNATVGGSTLISIAAKFLDAPGKLIGVDGAVICGLLLGFPANEIVLPLILMIYTSTNVFPDQSGLSELLIANGWTVSTCVKLMILTIFRYPCSTTLLTIKKEAGGRAALASAVIPTAIGILICALITIFV